MTLKRPLKTLVVSFTTGMAVLGFLFLLSRESQDDLYRRFVLGGNDALDTYLNRNYDVNKKFGDETLLDAAVQNDNWYMAGKLLDKGADVNPTNHNSITPLMRAALYSGSAIVKLLIDNGATITNRDSSGANAVNFAAAAGNPESIYLLVSHGANINNSNGNGNTPLLTAVVLYEEHKRNYIAILTLLYLGANINCTNKDGLTPIIIAAQHGDTNLVQLLNHDSTGLQHGNGGF